MERDSDSGDRPLIPPNVGEAIGGSEFVITDEMVLHLVNHVRWEYDASELRIADITKDETHNLLNITLVGSNYIR